MVATLNICSKCGACTLILPIPLKYEIICSTKNDIASDAQDIPGFIWVWGKGFCVFYVAKIYGWYMINHSDLFHVF